MDFMMGSMKVARLSSLCDRIALQMSQAGMTGAKSSSAMLQPDLIQTVHGFQRYPGVLDHGRLCQFKLQLCRIHVLARDDGLHISQPISRRSIGCRQIDADEWCCLIREFPQRRPVPAGAFERPQSDLPDETGLLGDPQKILGLHHTVGWMVPAYQRFESGNPPSARSQIG